MKSRKAFDQIAKGFEKVVKTAPSRMKQAREMVDKFYPAIQKGIVQGKEIAKQRRAFEAGMKHKRATPRHGPGIRAPLVGTTESSRTPKALMGPRPPIGEMRLVPREVEGRIKRLGPGGIRPGLYMGHTQNPIDAFQDNTAPSTLVQPNGQQEQPIETGQIQNL